MAARNLAQPSRSALLNSVQSSHRGALKILQPHEAEFLQDVLSALDDAHLKHAAAAALMGIRENQLSAQLVGKEHLSARRLGLLPPEFHEALIRRRAHRFGLYVQSAARRREHFVRAHQVLLDIAEDKL